MEKGPGRNCSPWSEVYTGISFLAGIITLEGPTLEQAIHKDCAPWTGEGRGERGGAGAGAGEGRNINFPDHFASVLL